VEGHVEARIASAPIDDRSGRDDGGTSGARHVDRLARRSPCGDDVFDDEHLLAG
jgi:hypothetical protein